MSSGQLPFRQLAVLAYMSGRGYVTVRDTSRHLRADATTVSNALRLLAARGYAEMSDTVLPSARAWIITQPGEAALAAEMTRDA